MMGKAKTQQRLIDNLADEFGKVFSLPDRKFCIRTFVISSSIFKFSNFQIARTSVKELIK